MVLLLIVMGVVLVLVARAWTAVAPEAREVSGSRELPAIEAHGEADAATEIRSGKLPRLPHTQAATDAHGARVHEALETSE
jgi:hypothetical protein